MRVIHFRLEYERENEVKVLQLFPGAHTTQDVSDTISPSDVAAFKKEKTSFLKEKREKFQIQGNVSDENQIRVSLCAKRNLLVDGTIHAKTTHQDSLLVLIQFKYKDSPSIDHEDTMPTEDTPLEWYRSLSKIEKMKKCNGITVIYVYITNARIPKKAKEALEECERLIVIEQSIANQFFAPNLLPYFTTIEKEGIMEESGVAENQLDISENISTDVSIEGEDIVKESQEKLEPKRKRGDEETIQKKPKN
jgi:hypothetical protein